MLQSAIEDLNQKPTAVRTFSAKAASIVPAGLLTATVQIGSSTSQQREGGAVRKNKPDV